VTGIGRLRKRSQFLRVRDGARFAAPGLVLQAKPRAEDEPADRGEAPVRFGFTASKKIGNAVARNRARRRLKEAVRLFAGPHAAKGFDYVLIARQGTLQRPFIDLVSDLERALRTIHRPSSRPAPQKR
jgi:ribonuclease P protein component